MFLDLIFNSIFIFSLIGVKDIFFGFTDTLISPNGMTEHFVSFLTLVCETVSPALFFGSLITLGPVILMGDAVGTDRLPSELKNSPLLELEDELLLNLRRMQNNLRNQYKSLDFEDSIHLCNTFVRTE